MSHLLSRDRRLSGEGLGLQRVGLLSPAYYTRAFPDHRLQVDEDLSIVG